MASDNLRLAVAFVALVACESEVATAPPPVDATPAACAPAVPRYPCAELCTSLLACSIASPSAPAVCQCEARVQSPTMPGLVLDAVIDCYQAP